MAGLLEYNATLVAREDLSPHLAVFRVKPDRPASDASWFEPGQYLTIGLNNEVKPELGSVRRPMSIASGPHAREEVEFYIRYVEHPTSNNPFTHLLWKANPGDRMYMRMHAAGKFTVRDTIGRDDARLRIFVAAGTGLAPFVSDIRDMIDNDPKADLSKIAICHGASYDGELGYREWLESIAERHGLRYLPTISRPHACKNWKGATGRVEDFFRPDRLTDTAKRLGLKSVDELRPERCVVFVCGLVGTIAQCVERLLPAGFIPEHRKIRRTLDVAESEQASLFFEQYDSTPPFDLKDDSVAARLRTAFGRESAPTQSIASAAPV